MSDEESSSSAQGAPAPAEGASASPATPSDSSRTPDDAPFQLPAPTAKDFDDEVPEEERQFCLERFSDLNTAKSARMHCTACNKHLGLSAHHANRLRMHPLLRTLVCRECLEFYNSGEFDKGEDGSELYCRWCGQGGQVYCCSTCIIVFCHSCVKRNFGADKINEIKTTDDWSCFVCNPKSLWCHRAALWAARRYCFWKNKLSLTITDNTARVQIQKECQLDESVCCNKRKGKTQSNKSKPQNDDKGKTRLSLNKPILIENMIQKKPTANLEKTMKRMGPVTVKRVTQQSPNVTIGMPIQPLTNSVTPIRPGNVRCPIKLPYMSNSPVPRIAPRPRAPRLASRKPFNFGIHNGNPTIQGNPSFPNPSAFFGYNNMNMSNMAVSNDNINLSLESLTQGLDVPMENDNMDYPTEDSVVCTPDFPLPIEPVCNLEEIDDNILNTDKGDDDDVQILTPLPKIVPKPISALTNPSTRNLDLNPYNIIQMTENDVTVNKVTGGLKFRIDPATLSTSKMYQLPDGRVFAVNINPNMPGGYSATIVTVNEQIRQMLPTPSITVKPSLGQAFSGQPNVFRSKKKDSNAQNTHSWTTPVVNETSPKNAPYGSKANPIVLSKKPAPAVFDDSSAEWYSFNLFEAVDLMTYVTKKLLKLKRSLPVNMRSKSVDEIKDMHQTFDSLLKTSCKRFTQLNANLNNEFSAWLKQKEGIAKVVSDDDAEIDANFDALMNDDKNDEPIFIDENSNDSNRIEETSDSSRKRRLSAENSNNDPLKNIDKSAILIKKVKRSNNDKEPNDVEDVLSFSRIQNTNVESISLNSNDAEVVETMPDINDFLASDDMSSQDAEKTMESNDALVSTPASAENDCGDKDEKKNSAEESGIDISKDEKETNGETSEQIPTNGALGNEHTLENSEDSNDRESENNDSVEKIRDISEMCDAKMVENDVDPLSEDIKSQEVPNGKCTPKDVLGGDEIGVTETIQNKTINNTETITDILKNDNKTNDCFSDENSVLCDNKNVIKESVNDNTTNSLD